MPKKEQAVIEKASKTGFCSGVRRAINLLEKVAREIIEQVDYETLPTDRAYGFQYDTDYLWSLRGEGGASAAGQRPSDGGCRGFTSGTGRVGTTWFPWHVTGGWCRRTILRRPRRAWWGYA